MYVRIFQIIVDFFTREGTTRQVQAIQALSVILLIFLTRQFLSHTFVEGLWHLLRLLEGQFISLGLAKRVREILMVECYAILLRATIAERQQVACPLLLASSAFGPVFMHPAESFKARDLHAIMVDLESVLCANQFVVVVV